LLAIFVKPCCYEKVEKNGPKSRSMDRVLCKQIMETKVGNMHIFYAAIALGIPVGNMPTFGQKGGAVRL
jgi:hypothetical protein